MVMYLFGENLPEIASLIRDPGIRELVRPLFQAERADVPSDPPAAFELAVRLGLLTTEGRTYGAGPRLTAIPAVAEQDLPERLRPALAHYVEIADDTASELRSVYDQTIASQQFGWHQVCHSLIAGMFLDLAMGIEIFRSGRIAYQFVGETTVWAFEEVSAQNAFGVQSNPSGHDRALFAQLWHRRTRPAKIRLSGGLVDLLLQVARGAAVNRSSKELLYLRHLKLVRTVDSSLRVQVPFFGPDDAERLLPLLDAAARRLVEDAIIPALEIVADRPWWRERAGQDSYRHAAVRLILEYGADRVIASKVLTPFPQSPEPPPEWGRWLWEEPEGPLTLIPDVASRQATALQP